MKKIKYKSDRPLMRLESGDNAIIKVTKYPPRSQVNEKDIIKYKDVPIGVYKAICTKPYFLECDEYPVLSGRYTFWYGDKWGCTEGIYADEDEETKDCET